MKLRLLGRVSFFILAGTCFFAFFAPSASAQYTVINVVSSSPIFNSKTLDSGLVNAWGLAAFPTSPFWLSAQNTSTSRLYTGSGDVVPLVVQIPCISDMSGGTTVPCPSPGKGLVFEPLAGQFNFFGPTGIAANLFAPSRAFSIAAPDKRPQPAFFVWDTLDGLIVGWNPNVNLTQGIVAVNRFLAGPPIAA